MPSPRKTIPLEDNTWSAREFAKLVGVSVPAVDKAVPEMTRGVDGHWFYIEKNGVKNCRRFTKKAVEWWSANRGEKNNAGGHGGRRPGGGRPAESAKRKAQSAHPEGCGPSTLEGNTGEKTLLQILDKSGEVDLRRVHQLSGSERKKFLVGEQAAMRSLERRREEGTLMRTADAQAAWSERTRAAARILRAAAARAGAECAVRLGLDEHRRAEVVGIFEREIDRAVARLMGREEKEFTAEGAEIAEAVQ